MDYSGQQVLVRTHMLALWLTGLCEGQMQAGLLGRMQRAGRADGSGLINKVPSGRAFSAVDKRVIK